MSESSLQNTCDAELTMDFDLRSRITNSLGLFGLRCLCRHFSAASLVSWHRGMCTKGFALASWDVHKRPRCCGELSDTGEFLQLEVVAHDHNGQLPLGS